MVLSDKTIRAQIEAGRIEIDPYDPGLLQPSSVDVRVDRYFRVFRNSLYPYIDVKAEQEDLTEMVEVDDEPFILHPGEFVLGSTLERVRLPDDLVARLEGKSSLGRLGLLIHSTAGFIDPGWDGHVTLELSNVANLPITIYRGMKIGQLSFVQLTEAAEHPYGSDGLGSKYQGQRGPDPEPVLEELSGDRVVKVLVTGGTGFVGPKVVHALRARSHEVRALVRNPSRAKTLQTWGCELAEGDVTEAESLRSAVEGCQAVVHLVAIIKGSPGDFDRVMVGGTENLIGAAKGAGVGRFVLMSALGTNERNRELVPVLPLQVGDGAGACRLGARAGRLSAELRVRQGRRRAADVRPPGAAGAADARGRQRRNAPAADLGGGRRPVLRAGGRHAGSGRADVRDRRP